MLSILKFILFLLCTTGFGFVSLNQLTKIKSLVLLIPLSISLGISFYIFLCHSLSFLIGPRGASVLTLFILLIASIIILTIKHKRLTEVNLEISKPQLIAISLTSIIICMLTFLAISRFGQFDKEFHVPFAHTLYHNNVYPPHDPYRPEYILLYHFGGDLLAGAINTICNFDMYRSFELISVISSGTSFLSILAITWVLTRNFKLSLISGLCTYFGGGLLWLDSILRYFSNNLPDFTKNWSLLQTFLNIGIHGGILNAPSISIFVTTFSLGFPILILSLILVWKMIEENNLATNLFYMLFLLISLFTLFLSAEWLYITFWSGVIPFLVILFLKKQKKHLFLIIAIFAVSIVLSKTIGNTLFLQDELQTIGRRQIFDIEIKEKLFWILSWGRLTHILNNYQSVFAFSWDFLVEFGFSLFLLPIALIYLIKSKNMFAILLFLCAALTMLVPLIFNFKINPVDLNRFFSFGNSILIILITCGIGTLYKFIFQNKLLLALYIIAFCTSPLGELISSTIFTPYVTVSKTFVQAMENELKTVKSISDFQSFLNKVNSTALKNRSGLRDFYKDEITFLKSHSKPREVAISNLFDLTAYAGIYTLIPSKRLLYKDLMYSTYDSIYPTVFSTLDPYLLNELNIKWILLDKAYKNDLATEAKNKLANKEIFTLVYVSNKDNESTDKKQIEIYHVNEIKDLQVDYVRKTAWLLLDENGQPIIELISPQESKIHLFSSSRNALLYLKDLYGTNPNFKKKLITAQAIPINSLEEQITRNKLNIALDKRF